jgi:signal transduction histidine kinase
MTQAPIPARQDGRAERVLAAHPGQKLRALAAQGTEEKVDRLLLQAREERVASWELILCRNGQHPTTFAFSAQPQDGLLVLVGSLVPEDYGVVLSQVSSTLSELGALHRETERQQRELARRADELQRVNRDLEESNRGVRSLHASLDEKAENLQRAAEVKNRVVANVSHEFRTPLHSILGLSKVLLNPLNGQLSSEQEKQVQFIRTSAEALYELVNDLLDLSKVEAGKAVLRHTRFEARAFMRALRGMMRPLLAPESPVELIFPEGAEGLELETDEAKLSQVLRNLISNAVKFTERGSITVTVEQGPRDTVSFSVKDTGIGIPAHKLGNIFELFTQVDESLERSRGGLGIGLTLVRNMVELHGGTIAVTSAGLGKGSEFLVRLPLAMTVPALVGDTLSAEERQRQRRILLVEDNSDARQALKDLLELWGHQMQVAQDGLDGVAMALEVRPELALVDMGLPGLDGYRVAQELRARVGEDIRLVAITGYGGPEDRHRALQAGFDHHLVKPVKPDELDRLLTEL